jgi:hypothetical protein
METSDRVPCLISVSIDIAKTHIFRFDNFLLRREDFFDQANIGWYSDVLIRDAAKVITTKFKKLRRVLKEWRKSISNLKQNILNAELILSLLTFMEEYRDLTPVEWNFKLLLENNLVSLL